MTRPAALPYPPATALLEGRRPTPIEPLERLSLELGITLHVKRDDLTGLGLTGNKVRKLEHLFAEARAAGCDAVITCGGTQSNHARATAIAAARLGMRAHLVLRGASPTAPPEGNLFLDVLCGATVRYITPEDWKRRDAIMAEEADVLRAREGRRPYVIPEGGSNALGAWGYVRCAEEIAAAEAEAGRDYEYVVCATGSGGTQAGLIAGKLLLGRPWTVLGFAVCDSTDYFAAKVGDILRDFEARFELRLADAAEAFRCEDRYIGRGYSLTQPEELRTLASVARAEGLLLDPTYTGKAFHGLVHEARAGRIRRGARVLFVHTGGVFGLLAKSGEFGPGAAS